MCILRTTNVWEHTTSNKQLYRQERIITFLISRRKLIYRFNEIVAFIQFLGMLITENWDMSIQTIRIYHFNVKHVSFSLFEYSRNIEKIGFVFLSGT